MLLYHYCSNQSFLSIIDSATVRASDLSLSNDRLEGKWSRQLLEEFCTKKNLFPITKALLLERFDYVILEYFFALGFCLSEEPDLLSQWRGYADDGRGVAIGFDGEFFTDLLGRTPGRSKGFDFLFDPLKYDIQAQQEIVQPYFQSFCDLAEKGALSPPSLLSSQTQEERCRRGFGRN